MVPICVFDVDPRGRATVGEVQAVAPETGYRWLHLDLTDTATRAWIPTHLPDRVAVALLQAETRPRADPTSEGGVLLNLRAINLNDGQEGVDMVSLRMWVSDGLIVSARLRKIFAVDEMRLAAIAGQAPADTGSFVARLADRLVDRIEDSSVRLADAVDEVEDAVVAEQAQAHGQLGPLRREVIMLHRFARPQRDALVRLATLEQAELGGAVHAALTDTAHRMTRAVEELESLKDRGIAAQDHLDAVHANRMARNSYALSVVAAVFLPLGFLTGVFGMNVGGLPGADVSWAFTALCLGMVICAALVLLVFRRLRWI